MRAHLVEELKVGQKASHTKTITETDVYLFAGISGDDNPMHINEEYAKNTFFKGRIAHGILSASLISAVLGKQLPGVGTIYMGQDLKFLAPVRFNDTITATVEVIEVNVEKNQARLKTVVTNQEGREVVTGEALVSPPKKKY